MSLLDRIQTVRAGEKLPKGKLVRVVPSKPRGPVPVSPAAKRSLAQRVKEKGKLEEAERRRRPPPLQRRPGRQLPMPPSRSPLAQPAPKPTLGQRAAGGLLALSRADAPERANVAARKVGQAVAKKATAAVTRTKVAVTRAGERLGAGARAVGRVAKTATDPEKANQALAARLKKWSGESYQPRSLYARSFNEAQDEAKPKERVYDVKTRTYKPEPPVSVRPKNAPAVLAKAKPLIDKPLEPLELGKSSAQTMAPGGGGGDGGGLLAYLKGRLKEK